MSTAIVESSSVEPVSTAEAVVRPRIWPLLLIAVLEASALTMPFMLNRTGGFFQFGSMVAGPAVGSLLLLIWLLAFSRIPGRVRWTCAALGIGCLIGVMLLVHPEVSPMGVHLFGVPLATISLAIAALCSGNLAWPIRWRVCLAVWCLGLAVMLLFRNSGMRGEMLPELAWRWSASSEARYLELLATQPAGAEAVDSAPGGKVILQAGDWPGFRGAARDGRNLTDRVSSDWKRTPPKLIWERPVGPGWSSFAVVDGRVFTQEQRGESEAVVCWSAETGAELWSHVDEARFWESVAGAGPRATPTFSEGRLFTVGATGLVNCLDAATGKPLWRVDLVELTQASLPQWGFAGSPCVIGSRVFVQAGAPGDDVLALDVATGEVLWRARWDAQGRSGYCSVQPAVLDGVPQILVAHGGGLASYDPDTGRELWRHGLDFPNRIVQPAVLDGRQILFPSGESLGTRLLQVSRQGDQWSVAPMWDAADLEPNFSDMVCHDGHAYGFDRNIFACLDTRDGVVKWKRGRFGSGQVLALTQQGFLLVISEKGDAVLLRANPDRLEEITRFPALRGKSWNHPVVAHGRLYVRNAENAACYEIGEAIDDGPRVAL